MSSVDKFWRYNTPQQQVSVSGALKQTGEGDLDLEGVKLTNVRESEAHEHVATVGQIRRLFEEEDDHIVVKKPLHGTSFQTLEDLNARIGANTKVEEEGGLNLNGLRITKLGFPEKADDAVTMSYINQMCTVGGDSTKLVRRTFIDTVKYPDKYEVVNFAMLQNHLLEVFPRNAQRVRFKGRRLEGVGPAEKLTDAVIAEQIKNMHFYFPVAIHAERAPVTYIVPVPGLVLLKLNPFVEVKVNGKPWDQGPVAVQLSDVVTVVPETYPYQGILVFLYNTFPQMEQV